MPTGYCASIQGAYAGVALAVLREAWLQELHADGFWVDWSLAAHERKHTHHSYARCFYLSGGMSEVAKGKRERYLNRPISCDTSAVSHELWQHQDKN